MLGAVGVDACPEGYDIITDNGTCEHASVELGLAYSDSIWKTNDDTAIICNFCGGCNPKAIHLGGHGQNAQWVCQEKAREGKL